MLKLDHLEVLYGSDALSLAYRQIWLLDSFEEDFLQNRKDSVNAENFMD